MELELEVGNVYTNRNGDLVEIYEEIPNAKNGFRFKGRNHKNISDVHFYTSTGKYTELTKDHPLDLVPLPGTSSKVTKVTKKMVEVARFVINVDTNFLFHQPHKVLIVVKQDERNKYHIFTCKVFHDGSPANREYEHTQKDLNDIEYNAWLSNALFGYCARTEKDDYKKWLFGEIN